MPAKKPLSLIAKHLTNDERSERSARESSLMPLTKLSEKIPQSIEGEEYKLAASIWKRSVILYTELKSVIATPLDENLLIKYCIAEQQFKELEGFRNEKISEWEDIKGKAKKIKLTDNADQINAWRRMWIVVNEMEKIITMLDARLDAKGKYIHSLQQSLYLTPRSRAGVEPQLKEKAKKDTFGKNFD